MPPTTPTQLSIETFFNDNHGTVNIYRDSQKTESKTEGAQVKLTATQKEALKAVCEKEGVGLSTWIADAIELKLQMAPYRAKVEKYLKSILIFLHSLP